MKLVNITCYKFKLALAFYIFPICLCNEFALAADVLAPPILSKPLSIESGTADDLLDPKVAFRPQFRIRDPYTAELKVEIAPGYYLYRDRLRVEFIEYNAPAGAEKNNKLPAKPQGKIKTLPTTKGQMLALSLPNGRLVDDPTFGRVAIFEKNVTVLVDLARFNLADKNSKLVRESIKLALVSQGCAAVGVCFPPQKQSFTMPLNAPNKVDNWVFPQSETTMRFSQSGLDRGGSSLGGGIVKPVLRN